LVEPQIARLLHDVIAGSGSFTTVRQPSAMPARPCPRVESGNPEIRVKIFAHLGGDPCLLKGVADRLVGIGL
jgi:hypothetical protein